MAKYANLWLESIKMGGDEQSRVSASTSPTELILTGIQELRDAVMRFEAQRSDHVLQLAAAVAQEGASRDRQTEALLLTRQRLTEIYEQREFIRAGLDTLRGSVEALHSAISVEKAAKKAVKQAVREVTGSFPRMREGEIEDGVAGRVGALTRFVRAVDRASTGTKILLLVLALLAAACGGGWLFLKYHEAVEEPHGAPVERALGHRPEERK